MHVSDHGEIQPRCSRDAAEIRSDSLQIVARCSRLGALKEQGRTFLGPFSDPSRTLLGPFSDPSRTLLGPFPAGGTPSLGGALRPRRAAPLPHWPPAGAAGGARAAGRATSHAHRWAVAAAAAHLLPLRLLRGGGDIVGAAVRRDSPRFAEIRRDSPRLGDVVGAADARFAAPCRGAPDDAHRAARRPGESRRISANLGESRRISLPAAQALSAALMGLLMDVHAAALSDAPSMEAPAETPAERSEAVFAASAAGAAELTTAGAALGALQSFAAIMAALHALSLALAGRLQLLAAPLGSPRPPSAPLGSLRLTSGHLGSPRVTSGHFGSPLERLQVACCCSARARAARAWEALCGRDAPSRAPEARCGSRRRRRGGARRS